jgi:hypothetical protein
VSRLFSQFGEEADEESRGVSWWKVALGLGVVSVVSWLIYKFVGVEGLKSAPGECWNALGNTAGWISGKIPHFGQSTFSRGNAAFEAVKSTPENKAAFDKTSEFLRQTGKA